jgi:hypothetical protein
MNRIDYATMEDDQIEKLIADCNKVLAAALLEKAWRETKARIQQREAERASKLTPEEREALRLVKP